MAHHGTYSGPEGYEAVIPYFGKVTIGRMKRNVSQTQSSDIQTSAPQQLSNMVEFSANTFMLFSQEPSSGYSYSDTELGVDWTSIFDVDRSYDWNQAFEYNEKC